MLRIFRAIYLYLHINGSLSNDWIKNNLVFELFYFSFVNVYLFFGLQRGTTNFQERASFNNQIVFKVTT